MKKLILISVAIALMTIPAMANLTFYRITSNAPVDIAGNFEVEVTNPATGQVQFKFLNLGTITPSGTIFEVYFDDGTILGSTFAIDDSDPDVDFVRVTSGGSDLPGPIFFQVMN